MRFTPRLHDTYVGQVVLVTVLLTWAVLVGLDVVMALSGEISDLGQGNYTFGHAVAWVLYTVPRRAYTMFPTAAVIGSLMGLGQLAASSELTALRASPCRARAHRRPCRARFRRASGWCRPGRRKPSGSPVRRARQPPAG